MELHIGQRVFELDLLAGAFLLGGLLGLCVGAWAWRQQWHMRRLAFEWLHAERRKNVALAEENSNLMFIHSDRGRWKSNYEASVEAQAKMNQALGERSQEVIALTGEGEKLNDKLAELEGAADGLRQVLADRELRLSNVDARNEVLSKQADSDAVRAQGLQTELAKANALITERGLENARIAELIDQRTADLADASEAAREALLSDMTEWFGKALASFGQLENSVNSEIENRTTVLSDLIDGLSVTMAQLKVANKAVRSELDARANDLIERSSGDRKSLESDLSQGFKDASERLASMEKSIREDIKRQTAELEQDVEGFKQFALSESQDAAQSEYAARTTQLELDSSLLVRKLSEQTRSIVSSPQLIDFLDLPGTENDVPANLTARVTTARIMRTSGRVLEAAELLKSCREEDVNSRTVSFDLVECLFELNQHEEAREILNSVLPETLENDVFRERYLSLRRTLTPGVFLCAMPKSAGVFIYNALATGLDKPLVHTGAGGYFPHMAIPQNAPDIVGNAGAIYHIHADADRSNIIEVNNRLDRMVLHLRDPRGALLSWAHFIVRVVSSVDPVQRLHYGLPKDIENWTFAKQLAWQVDNFLPTFVTWTEAWLAAIDDGRIEIPVLVTTYEDLVRDQDVFFDNLLTFHSIDRELFEFPARPSEGVLNFRKGDPLEWQSVFSEKLKKRAREIVPEDLRERFGWQE